jgi:peptide/nickel transport system substrate-binding protein
VCIDTLGAAAIVRLLCLCRLLVVLSVLALAGCARSADDTIRFGLASTPANLDPRYATDATSARINRLLYQRLVDFDENVRPVPSLASWERLAPTHYRFHLTRPRPDFHDGSPLTAHDVAATYRSILEPGSASPHAGTLQRIARIEVLDTDTLDFFLHNPDPLFPGYAVIGILPATGIERGIPFHDTPVGSGPFRFAGRPAPGRVQLVRDRDGQLFEFTRVGDPTVRVLKLLRGELDLLQNDLPFELLGYLGEQDGIAVKYGAGSNFAYLGFNLRDTHTGKLAVRRAIAHAIDRQAIIDYVLGGAARVAAALLPPEHWAGNPALLPLDYNPARSRELLKQAGFGVENPLQLNYKTSTDPVRLRIATILQQQLAEVGIRMTLNSYDWGTFFGDIKAGRFQLYSLMWVGIKTPDIFRYAFHSESLPPAGANRGRFTDAGADRLIQLSEQGVTMEEQAKSWRELQSRLLQQLPYVPLWYEDHVMVTRKTISGYRLSQDGNYDALVDVTRTPQ